MADVGSANVKITADDRNARQELSGFMGYMKKTGAIASGVIAGFAAFEGIKNGIRGAWDSTIGANSSMEQYQNTLSVVMKSSEKAAETLEWAKQFASSTPFEIPGIVEATTRLESYGLNAQEVLGATGDMAAVMGKPLMQAVEAVADAQTGELERLKEFGITKDMLIKKSEEMGNQEVVNAKGQITDMEGLNEALFAIMRERYEGGMELQSKTFKGLVSNATDAMGQIATELSRPVFDNLKEGMKGVVPVMSATSQYIKGDIAGAMDTLEGKFGPEKAGRIMDFFESFKNGVRAAKDWIMQFQPAVKNLMDIAIGLGPTFQIVGGAIAVAFMKVAEVLPPIINKITEIAAAIVEWKAFTPIVAGLAAAFVTLKVANQVAKGIKAMQIAIMIMSNPMGRAIVLTQAWRKAQMFLNATLLANPIGLVIAILAGLVTALVIAYKRSDRFREIVNNAWQQVKLGFQAFLNFFTTTLPAWVQSTVQWFINLKDRSVAAFTNMVNNIKQWWQNLKQSTIVLVQGLITGAINLFNNMVAGILNLLRPFIQLGQQLFRNLKLQVLGIITSLISLVTGDMEGFKLGLLAIWTGMKNNAVLLFTTLKNGVVNIARFLWNILKSLFIAGKNQVINAGQAMRNGVVNGFRSLRDGSINLIRNMVSGVKNFFSNLRSDSINKANAIKNGVRNGFNNAKDSAISAVKGMYNSVRTWLRNVVTKFTDMKNDVIRKVKSIDLYEIGKNVIEGFLNGLGSMLGSVRKKAEDIADTVKNATRNLLKLGSPSKLFDDYGRWTIEGYVRGMDKLKGKVAKTARKVLGQAPKQAPEIDADIKGISGNIRTRMQPFMQAGNGQEVHNHYWNVNADEINSVQQLINMVNGISQTVKSR